MHIKDYDIVRGLIVDKRIHEEDRLRQMIESRGGNFSPFIEGKGISLPRERYSQISPCPPFGWPQPPQGYYHFSAIKNMVKEAKEQGAGSVLIVEDDCEFTDEFDDVVAHAAEEMKDDEFAHWDILYYGANHSGAWTSPRTPHIMRTYGSLTTHCFGVRESAYDTILGIPPIHMIDLMIANASRDQLVCYALWPNVALQRPGQSTLWNQYVDYTDLFKSAGRTE